MQAQYTTGHVQYTTGHAQYTTGHIQYTTAMFNTIHYDVFIILQAIGDGGQGWGNFILYVFSTKQLRDKMFCSCKTRSSTNTLQSSHHNRFYSHTDNTFRANKL